MRQKKIYDDQLIVVTGAAGMIGSGVVRHLNNLGYKNLFLVDDLKCGEKWKNLVGKKFVDIVSRYDIFEVLQGMERDIEAIIHLGACSDTTETDADYLLENNYRFSVRLAEYALKNEQRFIYASSAATYGDGKLGFSDDEEKLEMLRPLNMYGYSKQLFDLWLKNEKALDKVVGLKYFNVFGPNEYHKGNMASVIFKMAQKVRNNETIQLFKSTEPEKYKDGEQERDFIYVKDAVAMTCALLDDAFKDVAGIFNIGSGRPVTWNELIGYLFKALEKKPKIAYVDMPLNLVSQYQNYTCADMRKYDLVHSDLSKRPMMTSLEAAVTDYVQNYLPEDKRW